MEQPAVVIRSRGLRGWGFGIVAGFTAVWALVAAFVFQIWARPAAFRLWLILTMLCLIAGIVLEVVFRLDYVKVAQGRIRWRFRGQESGDRPLSSVREVEPVDIGNGGISVQFREGSALMIGAVQFSHSDIEKLEAALKVGWS